MLIYNKFDFHYSLNSTDAILVKNSKLQLQGTGYYDIEDVTNKWLFMAVTYNGKKKNIQT